MHITYRYNVHATNAIAYTMCDANQTSSSMGDNKSMLVLCALRNISISESTRRPAIYAVLSLPTHYRRHLAKSHVSVCVPAKRLAIILTGPRFGRMSDIDLVNQFHRWIFSSRRGNECARWCFMEILVLDSSRCFASIARTISKEFNFLHLFTDLSVFRPFQMRPVEIIK